MRLMLLVATLVTGAVQAASAPAPLPPPTSPAFCVKVQQILASTSQVGQNTLFTDMAEYRHSKPFVNPLRIYQIVSYSGALPIMVSCKVKTAAHLRAAYGPKAAGKQLYCPDVTRLARAEAVAQLQAAGQAAAASAAAGYVVDENEPYTTGQSYLQDFELSYRGPDGKIHLSSPGLYQDYDSWITRFLPERVQGQSYCHLPTVAYIKALATGSLKPGTLMTTTEAAVVTPRP